MFDESRYNVRRGVIDFWTKQLGLVKYAGEMTVRVHEPTGTFDEIKTVEEHANQRMQTQYHSKYKKFKETKKSRLRKEKEDRERRERERREGLVSDSMKMLDPKQVALMWGTWKDPAITAQIKPVQWTRDTALERGDAAALGTELDWVRIDPEMDHLFSIRHLQQDFMWSSQLFKDKDVVAQYEAIRAFAQPVASREGCGCLLGAIASERNFYGVRVEGIKALAECAFEEIQWMGMHHLMLILRTKYCCDPAAEGVNGYVPKRYNFDDMVDYFILKAIPPALASIRDKNNKPVSDLQLVLITLLRNADSSVNHRSDSHYLSTLIESVGQAMIGSELNGNNFEADRSRQFMKDAVDEVTRWFEWEKLQPSWKQMIAYSCLKVFADWMQHQLMQVDLRDFLRYSRPGNVLPNRMISVEALLRLGHHLPSVIRYICTILANDKEETCVKRCIVETLMQMTQTVIENQEKYMSNSFDFADLNPMSAPHSVDMSLKALLGDHQFKKTLWNLTAAAVVEDPVLYRLCIRLCEFVYEAAEPIANTVEEELGLPKVRIKFSDANSNTASNSSSFPPSSNSLSNDANAAFTPAPIIDIPDRRPVNMTLLPRAEKLLTKLKNHPYSEPFLRPVDPMMVPTYYRIIRDPMDFNTVEKKLMYGNYKTLDDMFSDLNKCFENCYLFNDPNSLIYQMGQILERYYMERRRRAWSGQDDDDQDETYEQLPTSTAISSYASKPIMPARHAAMTTTLFKKAKTILTRLCNQENISFYFLRPVDPITDGCPTYLEEIKDPMDFGTIRRKLEGKEYTDLFDFESHMDLVFKNCMQFNPPGTPPYIAAQQLKTFWIENWMKKNVVTEEATATASASASASTPLSSSTDSALQLEDTTRPPIPPEAANVYQEQVESSPMMNIPTDKANDMDFDTHHDLTNPLIEATTSSINTLLPPLPFSVADPPNSHSVSRSASPADQPQVKSTAVTMSEEDKRVCSEILLSLKQHPSAPAFLFPVDWRALNLPTYPQLIKRPMDLSKIEKKLEKNSFKLKADFEKDVRLIFKNCFTFNGPEAAVWKSAVDLERRFNELLGVDLETSSMTPDKKQLADAYAAGSIDLSTHAYVPPPPQDVPKDNSMASRCMRMLRRLQHKTNGHLFWQPVSLEFFPMYLDKIAPNKAMDFRTIEGKLTNNVYHYSNDNELADQFLQDIMLIFDNCLKFNEKASWPYQQGNAFRSFFIREWKREMESVQQINSNAELVQVKQEDKAPERAMDVPADSNMDANAMANANEPRSIGPAEADADAPLSAEDRSKAKKFVKANVGPYLRADSQSFKDQKAVKKTSKVISRLMSHPSSGAFLHPVDPVAAKLPDYTTIITRPMDLGTVNTRLNTNQYQNLDQIKKDLDQIWSNAILYNSPDHVVHKNAIIMEKEVDKRWAQLQEWMEQHQRDQQGAPEYYNVLSEILHILNSINSFSPFRHAVDPSLAVGYYDLNQIPMDFDKMRQRLNSNDYKDANEFKQDIHLIARNCFNYNGKDSVWAEKANELIMVFRYLWEHHYVNKKEGRHRHQQQQQDHPLSQEPDALQDHGSRSDDEGMDASRIKEKVGPTLQTGVKLKLNFGGSPRITVMFFKT